MADISDYNSVYLVTRNGKSNNYNVGGTSPLYTNVDVVDSGTDTNKAQLVANDDLTFDKAAGTYAGTYTYVGSVPGGFIAQKGDVYLLFTNTAPPTTQFSPNRDGVTSICFLPGTQIATPAGEASVETLQSGDFVKTADGRVATVRWVGRQTISTRFADPLRVNPICIKAGALAENVPSRDLYVSPDHAILVDNILVHASALVNGTSIVRAPAPAKTFTYYHVELADHSLLLADNVPAESFIDNVDRLAFDNWDEHEGLGDETAPLVEMAYPRAKAARQVPVAIRERLAARAQALFGVVAAQAA